MDTSSCDCGAAKTWNAKSGDKSHSDWCSVSSKSISKKTPKVCSNFSTVNGLITNCADCGKRYSLYAVMGNLFEECGKP